MASVFPKSGRLVMTRSLHLNIWLEIRNLACFSFPFRTHSFFFFFAMILPLSLQFVLGVGLGAFLILCNFGVSPVFPPWVHSLLLVLCVPASRRFGPAFSNSSCPYFSFKAVMSSEPCYISSGQTLSCLRIS